MYLSYQILGNLARREMTTAQQREADEQLGRVVAGLARRLRPERPATPCGRTGAGHTGSLARRISKGSRNPACTGRIIRPAA
jgi:hypothetical protein